MIPGSIYIASHHMSLKSKTILNHLTCLEVGSSHASFQLRPPEMAKNNVNIASGTDPDPSRSFGAQPALQKRWMDESVDHGGGEVITRRCCSISDNV